MQGLGATVMASCHGVTLHGAQIATAFDPTFDGTADGRPFDGRLRGVLRVSGAVWPEAGTCKPGDASVVVDGPGRKQLSLVAVGDVCALSDGSALAFVGLFDSSGSTPARLDDHQGVIHLRVDPAGHLTVVAAETP